MIRFLAIFLGGGLGASTRWLADLGVTRVLKINLPIATFLVNVIGSFLLGFFFYRVLNKTDMTTTFKLFLTVGFCGGLTTFSTYTFEIFKMIQSGQVSKAIIYAFLSILVSLAALVLGVFIASR